MTSLPDHFAGQMGRLLGPDFPSAIGLAVSGGGDSMAMLHLAAGWARPMGITLYVATVDHGLRTESADEARMVAAECEILGLSHDILTWEGWDGQGNLMAAAREARLDLLNRWRGGVEHILFGHTADDVAETFVMRLGRGSGVEGLSAMPARQIIQSKASSMTPLPGATPKPSVMSGRWTLLRPMLGIARADLRHFAATLKIPFVDDPTNEDNSFARSRIRKALALLDEAGVERSKLTRTAERMGRATAALNARARSVLDKVRRSASPAEIAFDRDAFGQVEADTQLRLLAGSLQFVSSNPYRPRERALEETLDRALGGGASTLHGGIVVPRDALIYVAREPKAVEALYVGAGPSARWDRRFKLYGPEIAGKTISSLGVEGLRQSGFDRRRIPRAVLEGLPAVWEEERLFACRALGFGPPYMEERISPLTGHRGLDGMFL